MKVAIKKRAVDSKTGTITKEKFTTDIPHGHKYHSLGLHKLADTLSVNQYDRTLPFIYDKLDVMYNYIAKTLGTDKPGEIATSAGALAKSSGLTHLGGRDRLDGLHKIIRMDKSNKIKDYLKTNTNNSKLEVKNSEQDKLLK